MSTFSSIKHDYIKRRDRIQDLLSYNAIDTDPEKDFDILTELAATICKTPSALISLIDDKRQWLKSKTGIEETEVPIEKTICQYTIIQDELMQVENASEDDRLKDLPHITQGIRFYAGIPLKSEKGYNIGTVCVIDNEPKKLNKDQIKSLKLIAEQAMNLLEVRKKNSNLADELLNSIKQKLNKKEADYESFYETVSSSNILIEFDSAGNISRVNENVEQITGFKKEEFIGKNHTIFLNFNDDDQGYLSVEDMINDASNSRRIKIINKQGEDVWLQASFSPVKDMDGSVSHIIVVAHDITAEVLNQQKLEESKSLAEQLNIQKDQFIANMSHEIRTPINAVLGFTDLLLQMESDNEKANYLNTIKSSGDKLLYVVNDILDLSKIEAGAFHIDKRPFDLEEMIKNVFSMLQLKAQNKNLEFEYILDKGVPNQIIGDYNRISQVLINLLGNALKFTHKGFVKLSVKNVSPENTESGILEFQVSDTGIGISPEKLDTIFDRFIQESDKISNDYGGTGLGLNISKLLVEKQGGTIKVFSGKNKGSEFIFTIPYNKLSVSEEKKLDFNLEFQKETFYARILLCEDNFLNQKLIESIFTMTNYDLDIASDGIKGLKYLEEKQYDMILMDIQMPNKNGYQVTKEAREKLKLDIPIIGLSAHSVDNAKSKCLESGMNDYISKPFSKKELLDKINYWLLDLEHCLKFFDKEVDLNTMSEISLTRLNELSAGNEDTKAKLIKLFIEESQENRIAIKSNVASDNREELSDVLHQLKSSFGLIGAKTYIIELFESFIEKGHDNLHDISKCLLKQIAVLAFKLGNEVKSL